MRSVRFRLAVWYVGILAALLVAFAVVVYYRMRSTLYEQLDDAVETRAHLAESLVTFEGGEARLASIDEAESDDVFTRLFAPSGELISGNSPYFAGVPAGSSVAAAARDRRPVRQTLDAPGSDVRVLSSPVVRDGEVVAVLQAGQSTDDVEETLRSLLAILAFSLPAALVLAGLGGWWLSSRALSPIDRMTSEARQISGGGDLSRRLDLDLPDDEVGRLARTFDAMLARLDAAFERQRRFTADASHELRTPLTAMRGQIDVALERPRSADDYRRVLATVNDQVDRLMRLVESLLVLARADAGMLAVQREPVDIAEIANAVAEQLRPLAGAKGIDVTVEAGDASIVAGDEHLLLQLLLNLADNAVKYTDAGSVTIGWRAGPPIEVFVRDTGRGIPPEHRVRVFERFYRVDDARAEPGAGLGLSISRWIVEVHGGSIAFEPAGTGSQFTATFPVASS
jgi:heavy metal sensor kinase